MSRTYWIEFTIYHNCSTPKARLYAYNKLIGLKGLVNAYQAKCHNIYEMAEYLNVTVEFLMEGRYVYQIEENDYRKKEEYTKK